ncbi:hypothetical protein [Nocardioides ungokensis]|uniref:hypothetical protein n=1 Tax=Nocardioides ungokensis TaxID=1643322 RepID=UPI001FED196C|nr:hypothetical protein [Nocardioides ungokensis]
MTSTIRQDSTKKAALIRGRPQRARHRPRAAGGRYLEQHRQHRVGAEEPGEQDLRGVGLLDQPQRDDDVEQDLVGGQHAVAEEERQEATVAQRARREQLRGAAVTSPRVAEGSRLISRVLSSRIPAAAKGTSRITVSLSVARARPPSSAPRLNPMLSARAH